MPPAELPDDYHLWPQEPFELLGVPSQTDERTLKRAYTQLIRRYKPENFPEQFQLIRAAYEQAQAQLEFQIRFQQHFSDEEQTKPEPTLGESTHGDIEHDLSPSEMGEKFPQNAQEPMAWDLAKQGRIEEAFAQLKRIAENDSDIDPSSGKVYLQLYWIAKVFPELQQSAIYWLAEGIRRYSGDYSIYEALRQATDEDSKIAVAPEITTAILEQPASEYLLPYLTLHWQAAAKCRQLGMVLADLEPLRNKLRFENEILWGRIIIAALECYLTGIYFAADSLFFVVMADGLLPIQPYFQELQAASHLNQSLGNQLDRLDELNLMTRALAREGQPGTPFGAKWCRLIQQSAVSSDLETVASLPVMIEELVKEPIQSLEMLDQLFESNPVLAALLCGAIRQYAELREANLEQEPVVTITFKMPSKLEFMVGGSYKADYRPFLIHKCFQWSIQPSRVLKQTPGIGDRQVSLQEWLQQDDALNSIYLAWYAFHFVKTED